MECIEYDNNIELHCIEYLLYYFHKHSILPEAAMSKSLYHSQISKNNNTSTNAAETPYDSHTSYCLPC